MRPRRIFRPAPSPRRWGTFAVGALAALGAVTIAVAIPGDLFGSAPRDQLWAAGPGEVRVLDGDTLRLGDRVLRLAALDVPDRGRASCRDAAGRLADCAGLAAESLAGLIAGRGVECRVQGRDRMGRGFGSCRAGGVELNASQIAAGWALAESGSALVPVEAAARQARRGLWAPEATPPESWRGRR
ncbi:thermonuclease family protein [Siccirubricoccus sp. KC 17139]|uniref:Thermonuclease family protein n=1 Tax=Siccirubricoccus soli TaxID=2899147 RepID=A0ABT1D2Z5_9PROT|nr:thermonuclease family protein [Siccirubricoccus soli]MCO6416304.1 thermonuclease family protein [Siccirubricoccus soli]MCP2682438.1 thermonuclease family protein [Siccirubricoccus soli]